MKKLLAVFLLLVPVALGAQGLARIDAPDSLLAIAAADSLTVEAASADDVSSMVSTHLHFKKIPIDGTLRRFMGELSRAGYNAVGSRDGVGILEGRFAGIDDVKIYVYSSGDLVWKVIAVFPGQDTWNSMKRQYSLFKKSISNKYFVQPRCTEYFPQHIPEGTGREHNAFRDETGVWQSVFPVQNGTIILSVRPVLQGAGKMCLRLEYEDELNQILKDNAFMEDL